MDATPRYRLDPSVTRLDDGSTLVGGSDFTVFRMTDEQRSVLDWNLSVTDSGTDDPPSDFVRFLLDRNLVQPNPRPTTADAETSVAVVIPCRDDHAGLARLLTSLDREIFSEIFVVDDGSTKPVNVPSAQVTVLRHEQPRGAGAARETGWRASASELILFIDADVERGDFANLAGHLTSAEVAAVAPRVLSSTSDSPSPGPVAAWEAVAGSLDLGPLASSVAPRTRVPYVPTATLLVRRSAVEQIGGFDTTMLLGEDVDLIWRLHDAGWVVRYEPGVVVHHRPRSDLRAWLRQRVIYGRSNVHLAQKHPAHVAALEVSPWNVAPWLLLALSPRLIPLSIATAAVGVVPLRRRLSDKVADSNGLANNLNRMGIAYAGEGAAQTIRRSWWPLVALLSLARPWTAMCAAAALAVSLAREWTGRPQGLRATQWAAMRWADDLWFGFGVAAESAKRRSLRALRVHWSKPSRFFPTDAVSLRSPHRRNRIRSQQQLR